MQWIRCSERLPDKRYNYHVKVAQFSGDGVYNHAAVFDPKEKHFSDERFTDFGVPVKLNVIEWLDESQSESTPSIEDGWMKEKPEFKEECILITANWHNGSDFPCWNYRIFEIKKLDGETDDGEYGWYFGIMYEGEEWGDLEDVYAQLYKVILMLPPK